MMVERSPHKRETCDRIPSFFSLRIFFSNKNKLLAWESIHPLPATVRMEQHIYINNNLTRKKYKTVQQNINKLKVKTKKGGGVQNVEINDQNDSI